MEGFGVNLIYSRPHSHAKGNLILDLGPKERMGVEREVVLLSHAYALHRGNGRGESCRTSAYAIDIRVVVKRVGGPY